MNSAPDSEIRSVNGFVIVDDAVCPGGTKQRYLYHLFNIMRRHVNRWVYASPTFGYAQIAIARAARDTGKRAVLFLPARATPHEYTVRAKADGAEIFWVQMGFLKNCQAKAQYYVDTHPEYSMLVPFGGDHPLVLASIAEYARSLVESKQIKEPKEVWTAISSGTLSRGLQIAFPDATFYGVQVGHEPTEHERGRAIVFKAPEKYERKAKQPPPFSSAIHYDAKVWQFMKKSASPGALFWNVAGE